MGEAESKISRSDFARVYLQCDQPYYSPGDTVSGNVYVEVFKIFPCQQLELKVKGTEKIKWEENAPAGQNPNPGEPQDPNQPIPKITYHDKKTFFFTVVPLMGFGGTLGPGQYTFPFRFPLFEHVPGTFYYQDKEHRAKVRYVIEAKLKSMNEGIAKDQKYKTRLIVRQKPTSVAINQKISNTSSLCLCCVPKGTCTLEGWFERDAYLPGETCNLVVRCDNRNGQLNIQNFECKLVQTITFKTEKGNQCSLERICHQHNYDGVPASQETNKTMEMQLNDTSGKAGMIGEYEGLNDIIQPTVYGNLATCTYTLVVNPYFEGACTCCSSRPVLRMPLYVYAPPIPNWVPFAPPSNWAPKVYEVQSVVLNVGMPSINVSANLGGMGMGVVQPTFGVQENVQMNMNMNVGEGNYTGGHVEMNVNFG